jgi:hypothetical protein
MAEYKKVKKIEKGDTDQKHRIRQKGSQTSFNQSPARDTGLSSLAETPFYPKMEEHAATLLRISSATQRNNFIMQLHQTYGNSYVQRLMESINVQAKLTVSKPGDIYEQEADRFADAVTRAINSPAQRQEDEEELLQGKPFVQRQEEEEEEIQMTPVLQRQEEEEEEVLQGKPVVQRQEEEVQTNIAPMSIQRMAPFNPEKGEVLGEDEKIGGWAIEVRTDAGTPVIGWASDEVFSRLVPPEKLEKDKSVVAGKKLTGEEFGKSFFCHGYSLGTFGKFGYSVYGDFIHQVLNDEYNYVGDLASAKDLKRGDICVIGPLGSPVHSCVVADDQKGDVNPDTLKTDSKDIFGALEKNYPLRKHMDQYKAYPQITFFRKK